MIQETWVTVSSKLCRLVPYILFSKQLKLTHTGITAFTANISSLPCLQSRFYLYSTPFNIYLKCAFNNVIKLQVYEL